MKTAAKKTALRNLCLVTLFAQFALAFTAYKNVYLQDNGFTVSQIGIANAVGYVVSFLCLFVSGIISDEVSSIKKVLLPVTIISAVTYAITPFFPAQSRIFVFAMIVYLSLSVGIKETVFSLADNLLVRSCVDNAFNFGPIRAGGSISYAVSGILCAFIVPALGVKSTFWLYGLILVPAIWFLICTADPKYTSAGHHKINLRPLMSNRAFWLFVGFMFAHYLAMRPFHDMLTIYMQELDMNTDYYGLVGSCRAMLEVPSLIAMVILRRKLPLPYLVLINTALAAMASILMGGVIVTLPALLAAQCAVGLGNGLLLGSATNYINEIAPNELKATAASTMMMASSLAGLVGNLTAGPIMELLDRKSVV